MLVLVVAGGVAYVARGKPTVESANPPESPIIHSEGDIRFTPAASQMAAIKIAPVQYVPVPLTEPLNARVALNENVTSRLSAPVAGRVISLGPQAGDSVRAGDWVKSADWCYARYPLLELDGLTFGVVGWGRIGQATAEIARAMGMKIIAASRSPKPPKDGVEFVDVDTVFRRADVVSLHCPLTPDTKNLVNAERLALMKPTAFLLNSSRGPLLDEAAVAAALNSGRLAAAGLDVLSTEPPKADNPLLAAKNCLITPHQAWAAKAARARLMETTVANVRAFLAGSPQNVVN